MNWKNLVLLLIAIMPSVACSRGEGTAPSSSGANDTSQNAPVENAVKDYVASLVDGNSENILKYDKAYLQEAEAARQSVPSSMWPDKEAQRRAQAAQAIAAAQQNQQYNPAGSGPMDHACILVLKSGGTINFSKLEVRPLLDDRFQAFVQVDYKDQASAPAVTWQGVPRKLKSAMINLTVEPNGEGVPFVDPRCEPVEGALTVWETPRLSPQEAVQLASGVTPAYFERAIASMIYPATPEIRAALERQGMEFYYGNRIRPTDAAKRWVNGQAGPSWSDNPGWKVVLLDNAETTVDELSQNDARARASLTTTFSGCTGFCELWKELGDSRHVVFGRRASYDLNGEVTAQTTVNYLYDINQGWMLTH